MIVDFVVLFEINILIYVFDEIEHLKTRKNRINIPQIVYKKNLRNKNEKYVKIIYMLINCNLHKKNYE